MSDRGSRAGRRVRHIVVSAALVGVAGLGAATALAAGTGLDGRFGTDGVVVTAAATGAAPDDSSAVAAQRDGRIVVGGASHSTEHGWRWRLDRHERDGDPDPAFGDGGTVLVDLAPPTGSGRDEGLSAIAVQRDGRIVAVGFVQSDADRQESALIRLDPDGGLDPDFGDGGRVIIDLAPPPQHDFLNTVAIDESGNIVVGGGCRNLVVARFTPDGSLDAAFNPDGPRPGVHITEAAAGEDNSELLGLVLDGHGRVVGGGYTTSRGRVDSIVVRFRRDGTLDPAFNPNGPRPGVAVAGLAPDGGWDVVFDVAVDRTGRIVTAGDAFVGVGAGLYDIALSRRRSDGTPDPSFGHGGVVFVNGGPGDSDDDAQDLVIQPDGRILVGGSAAPTAFGLDSDFLVARLLPDGRTDERFGRRGVLVTPIARGEASDEIWAIDLQTPSRLVAAGRCDRPSTGSDGCLVRYRVPAGA